MLNSEFLISPNLSLILDQVSDELFVGIYFTDPQGEFSKKEQADLIERQYNIFYNHGMTGGDLYSLHEGFGYFMTDNKRFVNALSATYQSQEYKLWISKNLNNKKEEDFISFLKNEGLKLALQFVSTLKIEKFIHLLREPRSIKYTF